MREIIERKNNLMREAHEEIKKVIGCARLLKEHKNLSRDAQVALMDIVAEQLSHIEKIDDQIFWESFRGLPEAMKEESIDESKEGDDE